MRCAHTVKNPTKQVSRKEAFMAGEWQYTALKTISKLVCALPYSTILSIGASLGPL